MNDSRDDSIRFGDICMESLTIELTSPPGGLVIFCDQNHHLFLLQGLSDAKPPDIDILRTTSHADGGW